MSLQQQLHRQLCPIQHNLSSSLLTQLFLILLRNQFRLLFFCFDLFFFFRNFRKMINSFNKTNHTLDFITNMAFLYFLPSEHFFHMILFNCSLEKKISCNFEIPNFLQLIESNFDSDNFSFISSTLLVLY